MKPNLDNDKLAEANGPGEVKLTRLLPGPAERIWQYLTDPEKRARWFAGGPMEPRVGGKVELFFRHKNLSGDEVPPEKFKQVQDPGVTMTCRILRWEPPHVLSYTFDDESEVSFELTPQGDHVLLVVTHRSRGGDRPYLSGYASGWHTHLAILLSLLEGTTPPPFWSHHLRLRATYEQLLGAPPA